MSDPDAPTSLFPQFSGDPTAVMPVVGNVEVYRVPSGDATLHVEARGPKGAPLVVLLHGYPDDLRTWDPVAELLASAHRVIAFDIRGMGKSQVPAGADSHVMAKLLDDLDAVVAAETGIGDSSFHLVGHDWGGVIGWAYVSNKERAARVLSWTAMSTSEIGTAGALLRSPSRQAAVQSMRSFYILVFQRRGFMERVWRRGASKLMDRVLAEGGVPAGSPMRNRSRADILSFALPGLELYRQNLNPTKLPPPPPAGSVSARTLILVPQHDRYLTPPMVLAPAVLCADVRKLEVDAGHWLNHSHPELVAGAVAANVAGSVPEGSVPVASTGTVKVKSLKGMSDVEKPSRRKRSGRPGMSGAGEPGGRRGRVVVITGGAAGIGLATALDAAADGAHLVLLDRDSDGLEQAARACVEAGGTAETHVVDVTDRERMTEVAESVIAEHGAPDVLVNNAGVGMGGPFTKMSMDDWDWIRSINVDGVVLGCHLYADAMVQRGSGHIVNLASMAGLVPVRSMTAYNATKFAVVGFSEALAADLWGRGVAVTAVCPGIVDTGIISSTRLLGTNNVEKSREWFQKAYQRRGFGPEKVAAAIWKAVDKRHTGVLPVGIETKVSNGVRRLMPAVSRRVSRLPLGP